MTYKQVVNGQEGLRLGPLLLEERDAVAGDLLRRHYDSVHVSAEHFGHGQLVLLVDWAAQVGQAPKLKWHKAVK